MILFQKLPFFTTNKHNNRCSTSRLYLTPIISYVIHNLFPPDTNAHAVLAGDWSANAVWTAMNARKYHMFAPEVTAGTSMEGESYYKLNYLLSNGNFARYIKP